MEDSFTNERDVESISESDEYAEYRDTSSGCVGALLALVILVVGAFVYTALAIHDWTASLE